MAVVDEVSAQGVVVVDSTGCFGEENEQGKSSALCMNANELLVCNTISVLHG